MEEKGIENPSLIRTAKEGQKFLKDGKLYIMYNGTMYNVQGRRVK
jgi:predicted heme/steroid binding protein